MLRVSYIKGGDVIAAVYIGMSLVVNIFHSPPLCWQLRDVQGRESQLAELSECEPRLFLLLWFQRFPSFLTLPRT